MSENEKPAVMTLAQLGRCDRPGCDCTLNTTPKVHLFASCHPGLGHAKVAFDKASHTLELYCVCGSLFARIAVAGELPIGKGN